MGAICPRRLDCESLQGMETVSPSCGTVHWLNRSAAKMRSEISDAIESARTTGLATDLVMIGHGPRRYRSFDTIRAIVLAVAQELPQDMTMAELCDELVIANNQSERA